MLWRLFSLAVMLATLTSLPAWGAPSARIVKVLPHFIDKQNRIALNPSLYERDAYQAHLQKTPAEQGGLRFDIQWRSRFTNDFTLRLELRGNKGTVGTSLVLEEKVRFKGLFSTWSKVHVTGDAFTRFGELSAWRATLAVGTNTVAEQKSFLW